ncbi:hypothetical protein ACFQGT_00140 [Natrialbaceae archaeon GCM10025810]
MRIQFDLEPLPLYECFDCHYTWTEAPSIDSSDGGFDLRQCPCGSFDVKRYDERWTVDDDLDFPERESE